ncbi:CDP-alcohol phosphatidyltransferase family protein [Candidatus Uhrbacteria bacterium]|nr:CDP-alcohol phosphatidyltransferase family protein [Candidatus Uhrbacteria bacterium]
MAFARDPSRLYWHDKLMARVFLPLIPAWVTPNQITVVRFIGIPIVLYCLWRGWFGWGFGLFIFFSFTDALDGSLARVRRMITPWGTFYDPVADKILIVSVGLLSLVRSLHPVLIGLMIVIELLILLGGLVMRRRGTLISANIFGKIKMCLQVVAVALVLLFQITHLVWLLPLASVVLIAAIILATISLFTYGL